MTRTQQLLDLLTEAPSTTRELASLTGWGLQHVSALLCNMRRRGLVAGGGELGYQRAPGLWRRNDAQV